MAERGAKRARLGDAAPQQQQPQQQPLRGLVVAPHAPTVKEIVGDRLTALSLEHWGAGGGKFDAALVERLYRDELCTPERDFASRVMLLELSRYLEKCVPIYFYLSPILLSAERTVGERSRALCFLPSTSVLFYLWVLLLFYFAYFLAF